MYVCTAGDSAERAGIQANTNLCMYVCIYVLQLVVEDEKAGKQLLSNGGLKNEQAYKQILIYVCMYVCIAVGCGGRTDRQAASEQRRPEE